MAYTLITANRNYSSWSLRPWLLMKALGIPFAERIEPFTKPTNYDDFRAFSPTGQVPVLIDGPRPVWDSLGIVLYLAERHGGIWPEDADARTFAQSAACEMHAGFSALRNDCTMNVGVRVTPLPASPALELVYQLRASTSWPGTAVAQPLISPARAIVEIRLLFLVFMVWVRP